MRPRAGAGHGGRATARSLPAEPTRWHVICVLRPGLRAAVAGVRGGRDAFRGARLTARLGLLVGRRADAALRREPDAGGPAGPSARGRVRGRRGARSSRGPSAPKASRFGLRLEGARRDLLGFLADSRRGLAVQLPRRVLGCCVRLVRAGSDHVVSLGVRRVARLEPRPRGVRQPRTELLLGRRRRFRGRPADVSFRRCPSPPERVSGLSRSWPCWDRDRWARSIARRTRRLGRDVALKVLSAHLLSDREGLLRFAQEARAASALNHPNIVTIYEIGQAAGVPYLAMEFIAGKTLRRSSRTAPCPSAASWISPRSSWTGSRAPTACASSTGT